MNLWEGIIREGGQFPSDKLEPIKQRERHGEKERTLQEQQQREMDELKQNQAREFEGYQQHHREEEDARRRELEDKQRARDDWFKQRDDKRRMKESGQKPLDERGMGALQPAHYPLCDTKARALDYSIFPSDLPAQQQQLSFQQQQPLYQQPSYQQRPITMTSAVPTSAPISLAPTTQRPVSAADSEKMPFMGLPSSTTSTSQKPASVLSNLPVIGTVSGGIPSATSTPYDKSSSLPTYPPSSTISLPTTSTDSGLQQKEMPTSGGVVASNAGDAAIAPVFSAPGTTHDPNIVPPPTFKETVQERSKGLMKVSSKGHTVNLRGQPSTSHRPPFQRD